MKNIVTLTINPALDISTSIDHLEPNIKLRCETPRKEPGGGGINVSRGIHRLGGQSVAIYTRGGYTGNIFSELLEKENIDQCPVSIRSHTRENFTVTETNTGHLYRFGAPGGELSKAEYELIINKIDSLKNTEYLVASGSLPPGVPDDFYVQIARKAKKNNLKLVLDTSGKALTEILKEGAFLIKPSMEEFAHLSGHKTTELAEQKELLLQLIQKYAIKIIILSLGAKGALLAANNEVQFFPAPVVEQKSSVGAGDSMVAGIIYNLSQKKTIQESVLYGIACGTAAIMTPGTELFYKKDADELFRKMESVANH